MPLMLNMTDLFRLGLALAIGLLIGLERGWRARDNAAFTRIAGWRSFSLLALLGGVAALLDRQGGHGVLLVTLAATAVLFAVAYAQDIAIDRHWSITTSLVALLTVLLGALALGPFAKHAAAAAVVTTILLAARDQMHGALKRLTPEDLHSTLRFLLIAAVILPWLPDRGYGPFAVFNPYRLWGIVVLICGLSFLGYIAMRLFGQSRGLLATAAAGGLVSSTAVTLAFSRMEAAAQVPPRLRAAGIILACAIMPLRMMVILGVLNTALLALSWPVLLAAMFTLLAAIAILLRTLPGLEMPPAVTTSALGRNPLDIAGAAGVTLGLALVMLVTRYVQAHMGESGVIGLAGLSGLFDVDAMLVSIASLSRATVSLPAARDAIVVGALANSMMKMGIAWVVAPRAIAVAVSVALSVSMCAGAACWWLIAH